MQTEKKYFTGLNADDDPHFLGEGDYINAENIRWGTTDKGATGRLEFIGGTLALTRGFPLPSGSICIGGAVEPVGRYLVYFTYSPNGNSINMWDIAGKVAYNLLSDDSVTGGLGFSKDSIIHSVRIVNDILYWTDNLNEPRRFDIRAATNMNSPGVFPTIDPYTKPLSQSVLRWIRRQPGLPLTSLKFTNGSYVNNFIAKEALQFSYRYIYRGFELSTLSSLSLLQNYNQASETFNFIKITFPLGETFDQDVLQIDLVGRYLNSNKSFILKSWNRDIPADQTAIQNHNAGSALNFDFYNDLSGIALDDPYSVKPFDSLPIYAQTIEFAKNRAFMANYILGYDTPMSTSLAITVQESSTTVASRWFEIKYNGGANSHFFLDITNAGADTGIYDTSFIPQPPPFPPSVDIITDISRVALGFGDFIVYLMAHFPTWTGFLQYTGDTSTVSGASPTDLPGSIAFKSGSSYQVSIEFLDHAGRKCGVLTNSDLKASIAERIYTQVDYTTGINWILSNTNALTEIPVWAYYYSINITKSLSTRYFLQARAKNITYATKDADGAYIFNTDAFARDLNGVAIDFTLINSYGMGYTFTDNDLVKVYIGSALYFLRIITVEGNWLICELKDLGTIGNTASAFLTGLFEIYTPYKPLSIEPHYEVAQIYPVTDPATSLRNYSTLAGTIRGDITLLTRNDGSADYLTENMSPLDTFFSSWNTDSGRINIINSVGQEERTNAITYSDIIIQNTRVNGLSTFEALNVETIPLECGHIQKLQLANKISEEGDVMLSICTRETASLYLGEVQLLGSSSNAFLAQSASVIGTVNVLKGSYGTINPESVVLYNGQVFWFDVIKGAFVRYASNGLFPISNYKLRRVTKLLADTYRSTLPATIEAYGSRPFIFAGVDNYHGEILFTIPKLSSTVPKGTLHDYDSSFDSSGNESESDGEPTIEFVKYPYDIWDQQAKTLVFKTEIEGTQFGNKWMGSFTFSPEWMLTDGNKFFSFENGILWEHNDTGSYNTFYDVSYRSRIMFASNALPSVVKSYKAISIEASQPPTFTHLRSEEPYIQSTDLIDTDYRNREGVYYSGLYRDRLSPNVSGTFNKRMLTGDPIKTSALLVLLEFVPTNTQLSIRFVNVSFNTSLGHKT